MAESCPHCGSTLPSFRDAFCPVCRGPLAEEQSQRIEPGSSLGRASSGVGPIESRSGRNPLEHFTVPARVVVVLAIVAGVAGTAAYISWVYDDLSPGRYPLWLFALPVVLVVGLVCAGGLALLRACGVPVYRQYSPARPKNGNPPATE